MKRHERTLFNHLQEEKKSNDILSNVKNALGEVKHVVGNPLTKTEIKLQIRVAYYDNIGVYTLPVALPANLKTNLSLFLFGYTDFESGFIKTNLIIPAGFGWYKPIVLNSLGIYGKDVFLTGVPELQLVSGDLVLSFTDVATSGWQGFVVIHCENVAYGTLLSSFADDLITIDLIRYVVPIANVNQFINPITFGTQSIFGKIATDSIDPRMYITNKDFQQQIADIPVNLPIDKTLFCGIPITYDCLSMQFVLFVKKVEPLTLHN